MVGEKTKGELERLECLRQKEAEKVRKLEFLRLKEEDRLRKEAEKEQERLRKKEEKRKKEEERERERIRKEEDRRRKEEEKRKKEEDRLRKEEEKRRKDEEKEQERERERIRKEEEKRKKEEEKRKKEEDRLRKEEEKRKKDEEKEQERVKKEEDKRKREEEKEQDRLKKKQKLDEQEQNARRQVEFMQSFLRKSAVSPSISATSSNASLEVEKKETLQFCAMPFQLKNGMALAPLHRRPPDVLDSVKKELKLNCSILPSSKTYLAELRIRGGRKTKRTEVTKEPEENEVEIIDAKDVIENPAEHGLLKCRYKLLQFHTNVRPPYWGTWKRQSLCVKGRKPFAKEQEVDYEFDSDDEWEEEPEDGEDIGDKDDADREEDEKFFVGGSEEDVDEEDDFFVPHGYLSDDEGGVAEYRDKDTLKSLEEEFYRDMKRGNVNGLPTIETDNLDSYRMKFCPVSRSRGVQFRWDFRLAAGRVNPGFALTIGMPKSFMDFSGKPWDEVDLSILSEEDEISPTDVVDAPNVKPGIPSLEVKNLVPDNLSYLFGRYPMDGNFSITSCTYCHRLLSTTHMEAHVDECGFIPTHVRDEICLLKYGTKVKTIETAVASPKSQIPATLTTQLLVNELPVNANVSSNAGPPLACSSAPSSPLMAHSPVVPACTPPVSSNYSASPIKLEKPNSPLALAEVKVSAKSSPVPPLTPTTKSPKTLLVGLPQLKLKSSSVVLKIKGNSSSTASSSSKITLHAATPTASLKGADVHGSSPATLVTTTSNSKNQEAEETDAHFSSFPIDILSKPADSSSSSSSTPRKALRSGDDSRKIIPLRERQFNPNEHCGVINADGVQCKRSLTCKTHAMGLRRAVPGRSQPFDILIATQKQARDQAKLAKQENPSDSPAVSAFMSSNMSSGGDSSCLSDPSKLLGVTVSPSATISAQNSHLPASNMTCHTHHTLLKGSSTLGETNPPPASSIPGNKTHGSTLSPIFTTSTEPKKKTKRSKENGGFGILLQSIPKRKQGFDSVAKIIPPDAQTQKTSDETGTICETSPLRNGGNILLCDDNVNRLSCVYFPMIAISVGRKKKNKWRKMENRRLEAGDEKIPSKKLRREQDSMERLLSSDGEWGNPLAGDTITFTRGNEDEFRVENSDSSLSQPKVSFKMHPKKVCRPHHGDLGRKGLGMIQTKQNLNGFGNFGCQPSVIYDPTDTPLDKIGGFPPISGLTTALKPYMKSDQIWLTGDATGSGDVDAPVADSELSKLLAAQFEDY